MRQEIDQLPLYIENESDISEDEKGIPILMEEVELSIKKMKNGKATGVDGFAIELIKCLGEGKKEILSLCNKIYKECELVKCLGEGKTFWT